MPNRQSFLFQGQWIKVNSLRWHKYGHKDTSHCASMWMKVFQRFLYSSFVTSESFCIWMISWVFICHFNGSWVRWLSFLGNVCNFCAIGNIFFPPNRLLKHQSSGRSNVVVYWSQYVLISVCMCMQWADHDEMVGADVIARQEGFMVHQSNDGTFERYGP